jgi:CheY-like chemotaxis protein
MRRAENASRVQSWKSEIGNWKIETKNDRAGESDYRPNIFQRCWIDSEVVRKSLDRRAAPALLSAAARPRRHTFKDQRRIPTAMSTPLELEFVLVSSDYDTMNAVSGGVKKYGAKFILVPTAEAARDCLNRRKIDGVFVDLDVPGALGVMEAIRKGTSNSKAVIFACVADARENTLTLSAGANFLLRKPLTEDSVALHITIAKELLERDQRRYFRHAVNLPVVLKDGAFEQHARITNLSEGGMAVRTVKTVRHSSVIDFESDLSMGTSVSGKGQVAWINTEGVAGIVLQTFRGMGREHLEAWLTGQEKLGFKKDATEG